MPSAENYQWRSEWMAATPNVTGMARLLYCVAGVAVVGWGLWGADQGWTQWTWLVVGATLVVLGLIGYSPLHALLASKQTKAS